MAFIAALLAVGAATLIWQVASARAIMAALHGSELTLGLILASWLLLVGVATALAARLLGHGARRRDPGPWLAGALLLTPAALLCSLLLLRWAGAALDPAAGPAAALGATLICLAPPCLLLGGAFGLLSLFAPPDASPGDWAARIYLLESLGTVAAGILFHLALAPLPLSTNGLIAGAVIWAAGLLMLVSRDAHGPAWSRVASLSCALAGAAALALMAPWSPPLPGPASNSPAGYEVLAARNSRHGALTVLSRGDQRIFLSNGLPLFSSQDRPQIQGDMHITLLAHPRPGRVLLIGGGLGGGLTELLRHPVTRVDYVELDPELFALTRELGTPDQRAVLANPRVHLVPGDGRRWVSSRPETYDVIIVALPGPTSALINRFYTEQFMQTARRALRPGGLMRLTLDGSETYMGSQQALLHATMLASMERTFSPPVVPLPGQSTLLLAGRDGPPALAVELLAHRQARRKISGDHLGRAELMARLLKFKQTRYREQLTDADPPRNTDLMPAAYFQATLHWLAATSPDLARVLGQLGRLATGRGWAMVAGTLSLALLLGLGLRRRSPAGPALALVGFSGMALQLSLLLFCQEQRGVIYHEVGALLTAFMAGLAAGARAGAALTRLKPAAALSLGLASCAAAALLVAGLMLISRAGPPMPLVVFLAAALLTGLAVGACYAPAVSSLARHAHPTPGEAAAYGYTWDLAGAAAGALLAAVFMLPVLGLPFTCLVCAALCGGYAAGVWRG